MGNGKAAMELMGQWAPGAQAGESASKKGIGDDLAWFPFPTVAGGAGQPTDAFGGTDGWAIGKDAPPEAVDFVKFLASIDVAKRWAGLNDGTLPATNGAEAAVTDPYLKTVLENRSKATFAQLYLDQATTPGPGRGDQRRDRRALRGHGRPGGRRQDHHRGRQDPVSGSLGTWIEWAGITPAHSPSLPDR